MQITKIALIQLYKILKVTKRCMQRLVICSSLVFVVPYKDMRGQYVQITKIRYLCFDFVHSRYTRMAGFGRREIELMQALCIYNIHIEYYSVVINYLVFRTPGRGHLVRAAAKLHAVAGGTAPLQVGAPVRQG